jgi:hypothetical protein
MQIKMIQTRRGDTGNGIVKRYMKDESYTVPHSLAVAFINQGWAEAV